MQVLNVVVLATVLVAGASPVVAQQTIGDGSVGGRIVDPSNSVVVGAAVSARHVETRVTTTVVSDADGRFRLPHLRIGAYTLTVEHPGFAPSTHTLLVSAGSAFELPIVLAVSFAVQRAGLHGGEGEGAPPLLPVFLLGFAALVVLNSIGWVPPAIGGSLQDASRWCLVTAIAALGTKTSLGDLARVGWRPVAIIVGETLFVGLFVLAGLLLLSS